MELFDILFQTNSTIQSESGWKILTASLDIIIGAIVALVGAYAGIEFEASRQKKRRMIDEVCQPMLEEFHSLQEGDIPERSVWQNVGVISKRLLGENIREDLEKYAELVRKRGETLDGLRNIEMQFAGQLSQKGSDIIILDSNDNLMIRVDNPGHPQDQPEFRFRAIPLREFLDDLGDLTEMIDSNVNNRDELPQNIERWASDSEYDNLIETWRQASSDWESEVKRDIGSRIILRYQEATKLLSTQTNEVNNLADNCESDLEEIVDDHFSGLFDRILERM